MRRPKRFWWKVAGLVVESLVGSAVCSWVVYDISGLTAAVWQGLVVLGVCLGLIVWIVLRVWR